MSSKIARRVGAIAGLVLIPTIALGTAANAAVSSQSPAPAVQKQASGSQAGKTLVVKGTITSVKQHQGKRGKAETITVRGGHGKSAAFNVLPVTQVTKNGHRVSDSALRPGQNVTVTGKKAPHGGTNFAQRVAIHG